MKYLKRLGFVLVIIMVGFACSDNTTGTGPGSGDSNGNGNGDQGQNGSEDTEETTVEDDKDNVQSSMDGTIASMQELMQGGFFTNVQPFVEGQNSAEWTGNLTAGFEDIFMISSDNRFSYSSRTGVYEWNSSSFEQTSSSDNITVKFPSSESSTSNDATLTVSDYNDAVTTIDGIDYWLPTGFETELAVSEKTIFGLYLNDLELLDNEKLPIPKIVDLEIFTSPLTHALTFERKDNTNFSFTFDITNDDQLAAGISLDLTLNSSTFSGALEDNIKSVSGDLRMGSSLTVDFSVEDFGELAQLEDPSENEVNGLVDAEVLYDDEKVGDLEYRAEQETLVIVFSDGSEVAVDSYFEEFSNKVEMASKVKTSVESWIDFAN